MGQSGAIELQQQANIFGVVAFGRMPQTEISNFVETFGQDMLKEATNEFVALDAAGVPAGRFAPLVLYSDGVIVETDDAGVGDGNAEDVSRKIFEHGLLALAPRGDVDDPALAPDGLRDDKVGTFLFEQSLELIAHQLGQGIDRDQKHIACRMPIAAVVGNAAAGDKTMNVGVIEQLLGPGVQDGKHPNGTTDEAAIAGEFDDGIGGRFHQQGVAISLV